MINRSIHYDDYLWPMLLVEKKNKPARSPYSLEIRPKTKNFKCVFLESKNFLILFEWYSHISPLLNLVAHFALHKLLAHFAPKMYIKKAALLNCVIS